jgi:prepilin-type N-terminal cleavage/methylation domain-containing protein
MRRAFPSDFRISGVFTSKHRSHPAFTLLELLVVMGILAIMLVAIIPVVSSLSKSSGRKAAISNLLGALEQARTYAITDGQATYLVFPTQVGTDVATIQRYAYRSYAIFEDDPAGSGTPKQLTKWQTLPTGVSLRSGSLNFLATSTAFPFTPVSPTPSQFPSLKFNSNGEVDSSSTPSASTGAIQFGIFEGFVGTSGNETKTSSSNFTETIYVSRLTGRAEYKP